MTMQLQSEAFDQSEMIPDRYTCRGKDMSPPLEWVDAPEGTQEFALVCDDPDAPIGTWVHWVAYGIPSSVTGLPQDVPPESRMSSGGWQGTNSWGRIGYGGPCPPSGTHRYFFRLYALDRRLELEPGISKAQLLKAIEGHILAQCELMGRYSKH